LAVALGVGMTLTVIAGGIASAEDSGPGADARVGTHSPRHVSPAARRSVQHPGPAAATAVRHPRNAPRSAAVPHARTAAKAAAQGAPTSDPFTAFFANTTPRVTASQTDQSPDGIITGTLDVMDPDGGGVGVAITRAPTRGTVAVSAGQYTYTADPLAAHTGYTDSFGVTVSDADSGFHIHGLAGLLNILSFGLLGENGHRSTSSVSVTVAPFNNAPTATVRTGSPDPISGVVRGAVIGSDPNGDTLSYTGSATTTNGAVIVSATGDFSYTPNASAFAGASSQDTFTVSIDDGYGGITAVPVFVTIGLPAADTALSTFCGCTLMPADTVFHADVSALPVLAKSTTWTTLLGGTLRAAWGGEPWMGSTGGMPVNTVAADRPTERVIFNRGLTTSGPTIDDRPYAIPDYPIVEGMPNVPAWDRHLLVFQEGTCISQELYNVANGVELPANSIGDALANGIYASLYGSAWIAEAGVRYDMSNPLYPSIGEANASQLPYLPLILRPDDLDRGTIDHMLGIVIAKDRGTGYTWPARSGDGTGTNPDGVPMGTVLRLRSDFDMTEFSPATQIILRALQQHGAVIYDSFGPGQDGAGLLAMSNGWSGTTYLTAQQQLRTVPLTAFEAVDVLSLAVDPTAGWVIGSSAV
jgi:VCBS repeat-containing protein